MGDIDLPPAQHRGGVKECDRETEEALWLTYQTADDKRITFYYFVFSISQLCCLTQKKHMLSSTKWVYMSELVSECHDMVLFTSYIMVSPQTGSLIA